MENDVSQVIADQQSLNAQHEQLHHQQVNQQKSLEKHQQVNNELIVQLEQYQQEKQLVLANADLNNEQALQTKLQLRQGQIVQQMTAVESARRFAFLSNEVLSSRNAISEQTHQYEVVSAQILQLRVQYKNLQLTRDDLVLILDQQKTILSLSEHRRNLQLEEACPLCGSIEHPAIDEYSKLADVESSEHQQRFDQLTQQLQQLEQQGKAQALRQAQLKAELDVAEKVQQEKLKEQQALLSEWQLITQDIGLDCQLVDLSFIESFNDKRKKELEILLSTSQKLQQAEQNLQQCQQQLMQVEKQKADEQNQVQLLSNNQVNIQTSLQQLTALLSQKEQTKAEAFIAFKADVDAIERQGLVENASVLPTRLFDDNSQILPSHDVFSAWYIEKNNQVKQYQLALVQQEQCSVIITDLKQKLAVAQMHQKQVSEELELVTNAQQQFISELQQAQQQRFSLFEDKDISQIRAGILANRKATDDRLEKLQKAFQQCMENHQHQQGLLVSAEQQLNVVNEEVETLKLAWNKALASSDFATEIDFTDALLPVEQQQLIQQVLDTITIEKQRCKTLLEQYQQQLKQLTLEQKSITKLGITEFNTREIADNLLKFKEQLKQEQIKQGQLSQTLKQDEIQREQQQGLVEKIVELQVDVDDLAHLNGLVGSADGAKFRKFAQGLTLAHLVYLANQQLERLHARYQLKCQQSEALTLEVLDTWQADSVRDTKTLSGGESFLVSLALALALSDLVSAKTSIDSLFLDEGFGTLDNDTLEVALDALDSLNASGKMIGVISHVDTLKERIPVQIKVKKRSGLGVSELESQFKFSTNK
jgi:exonuclease SbcC